MAHVSSFQIPSFAWPEWRPRTQSAIAVPSAPAKPSHPICAARLGGFIGSLWRVCDRVTASAEDRRQLRFSCVVTGEPPAPQLTTLIRLANFLVADAAGACADADATGHIEILVERRSHHVLLRVEHDGWSQPRVGGERSLAWARRIAEASGGELSRQIDWDRTVTSVMLPSPGYACRHST